MCILCVIQKWSRKVATMLPWLVIPLIGLWLLSQFLPPAFRFEITSPRLACVLVLLVTLFWYEILMPQLSSWRARRNARIKERKRLEAIEMQKLKKNAVRRCRNCRTPYRDQNPSGGKFSCSYCGHKSKRPEMDLYSSPDGRFSNSGVFKDLIGKIWSDNSWICGQDWLENGGNWKKKKNSVRYLSGGNDHFLGIIWLFRKLFKISFNEDDSLSDSSSDSVAKNGENCNETRSERARRKAEEKKQARLERQQLEEEERKQREEVARLVEEQRKLRDENNKNNKKDLEKKRKQRKIDNKSSSDVDEVEKRVIKETQKNKKPETDNRENIKSKVVVTNNNYSKESVGARYLKGNFFGKGTNGKASSTREHKSSAVLDHTNKRDSVQPQRAYVKPNLHPDDQNQNRSTVFESQPCPPPKRSWQQLFTRSSPASSSTNTNIIITRPNGNPPTEKQINSYPIPTSQGFDVPITHGLPYPNPNYPYPNTSTSNFENGPVLDNFKLDLGFLSEIGAEKPSPSPKPIKSPVSKVWNSCDEKTNLPLEDGNDKGWQMWNSSPICPDTLGLFSPQKPMLKENCNYTNGYDPWALRTSNGPSTRNGLVYGLPNGPAVNHPFHGGVWAKKENAGEGVGTTSAMIGAPGSGVGVGVYSPPPDVQSLWAYE